MRKWFGLALVQVVLMAFCPGQARAQGVFAWDWELVENEFWVNPGDVIHFEARIFNNSTNGSDIGPQSLYSTYGYMDMGWGPVNLLSASYDLSTSQFLPPIAPGDSREVSLATWQLGPNPSGNYFGVANNIFLGINLIQDKDHDRRNFKRRYVTLHIGQDQPGGGGSPVVPEPASVVLFSIGLGGAALKRHFFG